MRYENVSVLTGGDIQARTGDGHACAYGFAAGTTDGSAGFGCDILEEVAHVTVRAANIRAVSAQGASSAIGFARFMQGYTHDCRVEVSGQIAAFNAEGDVEENDPNYSNGDAYAYGFLLNTGGWTPSVRRSFVNNEVKAGRSWPKPIHRTIPARPLRPASAIR